MGSWNYCTGACRRSEVWKWRFERSTNRSGRGKKAEGGWCYLPAPGGGGGSSGVKDKNVSPAWKQLHRGDRTFVPMGTV